MFTTGDVERDEMLKALSIQHIERTGYFKDRFRDSTRRCRRETNKKLGYGNGPYSRHHLMCEQPTFYTLHALDVGLDAALDNWMGAFDHAAVSTWREAVFDRFHGPVVGRLEVGGRDLSKHSRGRLHAHVIAEFADSHGLSGQAVKPVHDLAGLAAYFSKAPFPKDHVVHGYYLLALRTNATLGKRLPPLHLKRGVPNSVPVLDNEQVVEA